MTAMDYILMGKEEAGKKILSDIREIIKELKEKLGYRGQNTE